MLTMVKNKLCLSHMTKLRNRNFQYLPNLENVIFKEENYAIQTLTIRKSCDTSFELVILPRESKGHAFFTCSIYPHDVAQFTPPMGQDEHACRVFFDVEF